MCILRTSFGSSLFPQSWQWHRNHTCFLYSRFSTSIEESAARSQSLQLLTPNPFWEIIRHDLLECVSSEHFLSLLCIHIIYSDIGVVHVSCDEDSSHRLKPLEWNHKVYSYFHEANVFWECDSLKGLFELAFEHLDCDSSNGS